MKIRLVIMTVLLTVVSAGFGWWYLYTESVDLGDMRASIIIEPGSSFGTVSSQLMARGIVKSELIFKIAARISGLDKKLTPGRYDFDGENSCRSVLEKLRSADLVKVRVTLPEGSTIWQVASILARRMNVDSAAVVALNTDSGFLQTYGLPYLEGYLFPETYFFPWGEGNDVTGIVGTIVDRCRASLDSLWPEQPPLGISQEEIIILASIVEAEARIPTERPIIASVYSNRVKIGMKLEADPTVIYGLGGLDRPLWRKDLRRDTPYNTYLHKGFPPTPINSPGLAAVQAVLRPAETEYLFFVADDSGGHQFSRTFAEHNRARQRIAAARSK